MSPQESTDNKPKELTKAQKDALSREVATFLGPLPTMDELEWMADACIEAWPDDRIQDI